MQTVDYLQALNIAPLCAKQCVLLMWATFPCLPEALTAGKAWGFVYKITAFVWIKKNKRSDRLFFGLGHYTRANAEIVLLFTRGQPLPRKSRKVEQVLISRIGPHSVKPAEVRSRIVQLFGDVPRLELFARSREGISPNEEYAGWDVFGKEALHSITLPVEPIPRR